MVRLAHRGGKRNWLRDVEGLIPRRWGKQEGLEWRALARCQDSDRGHRGTCPKRMGPRRTWGPVVQVQARLDAGDGAPAIVRSEERRVGKECGSRWWWVVV